MFQIQSIQAREILDSRGNPTIQVDLRLSCGAMGRANVPSGASTGIHEAKELRDKNPKRYQGLGVLKAIKNVRHIIAPELLGQKIKTQADLDNRLCQLDGTPDKSKLGANAILGVSLAFARAVAQQNHQPLYQNLGTGHTLPMPMMNILNGGKHADNHLPFQELMIVPVGAKNIRQAIQMGSEIFHSLKDILLAKGFSTGVGDEGGFTPTVETLESALNLILKAIQRAKYQAGKEVCLALDVAASEFYNKGVYYLDKQPLSTRQMIQFYEKLCQKYPIISIEDGLAEDDWAGWQLLTQKLGNQIQVVGDDLFTTNPKRLAKGIQNHCANAILIKPNQIGTLTETLQTIHLARENGYHTIISHRSGETEDAFIADLAVATRAGQIKAGSLSRSERLCKYNRLMLIEEELGKKANFNRLIARGPKRYPARLRIPKST